MLSINDVTKIDEKRKHIKKEIYKTVELGNKQIFLTIPAFLVGFPVFDRAVAAQYIARQFKNGGFNVSIVGEYEIYINWIIEKPKKDKPRQDIVDESEFPDLMNLKKMANKYRK